MERAIILYRMSTDKQDLETQKRMNRNFCKEKEFEIVGEYYEDGVSGYKNPLSNRPDLLNILDKAERKEFDVLVVYIFDRIVRREEEYPLILSHFDEAIMNDENSKADLISKRIANNEDLIIEQREEINKLQSQLGSNMEENMKLIETYNEIDDWISKFESVDMGAKKTMLLRIIDKVYLYKNDIKVVFKFEMHHSVLPPKGNPSESKTLYHDKNSEYVYITVSQPINV